MKKADNFKLTKFSILKSKRLIFGLALVAFVPTFLFTAPKIFSVSYQSENLGEEASANPKATIEEKPKTLHVKTPASVKGIYMTSCVVGTPSIRDGLVKLVEDTELNSIIIDIKDFSGTISFRPENPDLMHMWEEARCGTLDMKEFVKSLHEKEIYVIGRITVFQDPHLTARRPDLAVQKASDGSTWKDFKGLSFTNPAKKEVWDYHIALAKESFELGFDEINFDRSEERRVGKECRSRWSPYH